MFKFPRSIHVCLLPWSDYPKATTLISSFRWVSERPQNKVTAHPQFPKEKLDPYFELIFVNIVAVIQVVKWSRTTHRVQQLPV